MSWTEPFELDGVTVGATELSILSGTTSLQTDTTKGVYQLWLDVSTLAKGDRFIVRFYDKVEETGGTKRIIFQATIANTQAENWIFPPLPLGFGWDITIQKLAGTDRAFDASIRKLGTWVQVYELDGVTIGTTPLSVISGNTTPQNETTKGFYWLLVDPIGAGMAKGDEFSWDIKEKVEATGGTQRRFRLLKLADVECEQLITEGAMLGNGFDVLGNKNAGTDRAFDASLRKAA